MRVAIALAMLLSEALPAWADALPAPQNQQVAGLIRTPIMLPVTLENGQPALLDAFVTRPANSEPAPVALITNGTADTAGFDRFVMNPNRYASTAMAFARHGYAAVVVLRQGYGQSSGAAEYTGGSCAQPHHRLAGERDRSTLLAALKAIRQQPWASPKQAVLVGISSGGFAMLATGAANPPGVQSIINFDGGRGALDGKSFCDQPGLLKVLTDYGKRTTIPSLWLCAANDRAFPPATAKAMFSAYQRGGAPAQFVAMPAFGENGHTFMDSAPEAFWWSSAAHFLQQQALPYQPIAALPQTQLPVPSVLNEEGRKAFQEYAASQRYEKAFAIDAQGDWGVAYWARTRDEAAESALGYCAKQREAGKARCHLYTINNEVVPEQTVQR
ncbi:CocE/NonD family hydrolase [Kosakonia cowanii]|uniref:dienelactone hydrolase family protein n=1 Tax=Kosakonia cowanii TaxID=208223 RepID=UPI0023F9611F|nr:CocE/NonD family hydrolase [Kosakonia cowanii]MDF7759629.1 CocE/NonD family hydrolase [Kosakonia cowanii]